MSRRRATIAAALAASLIAGCVFRPAEAPRFYRPASAALEDESDADAGTAPTAAAIPIRLHTVESAPFLRERVVWRVSAVEYGLYEQRRWIELPSRYLRRALTNTLASTPGLALDEDATAAHLDVELQAFDEVLSPKHEAVVSLDATVHDGERTLLERTITSTVAIERDDGAAMAEAMGHALDDAVTRTAQAVAAALARDKTRHGARPCCRH